ncbi:MAG: type 1 glutamine amidotransferase [Planctomycetota bacterium]
MNGHLLLLDNAVHRDIYRPYAHWKRYVPADTRVTRVPKEDDIPPLDGFTHILITGSEASILDPDDWVHDQAQLVRDAVERRIPLLGSCHAHQLIAMALAGPACVRHAQTPEFGWVKMEIEMESALLKGARRPAWAFCSHFNEVVDLPAGFSVLARSQRCGVQAFQLLGAPVFGVQAHPEITPEEGEKILADFPQRYPEMRKHPFLRPAHDSSLVQTIVENFLAME